MTVVCETMAIRKPRIAVVQGGAANQKGIVVRLGKVDRSRPVEQWRLAVVTRGQSIEACAAGFRHQAIRRTLRVGPL